MTVNADGSFVYTADPGYAGADSFRYLVSDGQGGTTVGTVTLLDPAPVGGFQVTAVAGSASGPQTVATFACPGAVAADFTAMSPGATATPAPARSPATATADSSSAAATPTPRKAPTRSE